LIVAGYTFSHDEQEVGVKRVAARQLRLLRVLLGQLVTNAVEELDVALLRVLLQSADKGPGHGSSGLGSNGCVGTMKGEDVSKTSPRACACVNVSRSM
jgi:hypothetical protein